VRAVVNFRLCEMAIALDLIVATSFTFNKSNYQSKPRLQSLIHKTNMIKSIIIQFSQPCPPSCSQILPSAPCSHITKTIFSPPRANHLISLHSWLTWQMIQHFLCVEFFVRIQEVHATVWRDTSPPIQG
jgi:hypothetical protein